MSKKEKIKQANLQSDNVEMEKLTSDGINVTYEPSPDNWIPSDGITMMRTGTVDSLDPGISYSFGDLGDLDAQTEDMFEAELRKKYPALQDAYEHYQNIKRMCETREKEEDEN